MKKLIGTVMAAGCLVAGYAAECVWIGPRDTNSPTNSYAFNDAANWLDGRIPSAIGDIAYMTNIVASKEVFINVPDDWAMERVYGYGPNTLFLFGDAITLQGEGTKPGGIGYKTYGTRNTRLYFDKIKSETEITVTLGDLCGSVECPKLVMSGGVNFCRFDQYTVHSGEIREDELLADFVIVGDASFILKVPHKSDGAEDSFNLVKDSPYAEYTGSGKTERLTVGSPMSGNGIPEGTYLRRIFGSKWVEMSNPATENVAKGNVAFGAFNPVMKIDIPILQFQGLSKVRFVIAADGVSNDATVEIAKLQGYKSSPGYVILGEHGYASYGKMIFHDTAAYKALTMLGECKIQFEENSGLTNCVTTFENANYVSTVIVTNDITAEISSITNFIGNLRKEGDGTLRLGIRGIPEGNTGSISVDEGTVEILNGDNGGVKPAIGTVTVAAGATLRVSEDGLNVGDLIAEEGAKIEGAGKITVTGDADLSKAVIGNGVTLKLPSSNQAVLSVPDPDVVGTPAFWVATDEEASLILSDDGTKCVKWIDVRGESYGFATNVVDAPVVTTNLEAETVLHFAYAGKDNIGQSLVWDKPVSGIKAVFAVLLGMGSGSGDQGGPILASTDRVPFDFRRDSWAMSSRLVVENADSNVDDGIWYIDGERVDPDLGWPYTGKYRSRIVEVHVPREGASADAFGYGIGAGANSSASMRIAEVIVYTNELSYAERLQVGQYLMRK